MGFRDYSPGLNRFLTRDTYNGALADMHLAADPWTGNRYAFGGGNPVSYIELDGHTRCDAGICPTQRQTEQVLKREQDAEPQPMVIDPDSGLCVANCAPIIDAVDAYYRANGCEGFSWGNWLGLVGLSPCGQSRDEVQRLLFQEAAKQKIQQDKANSPVLPFLPAGSPNNAEIADRIARHVGDAGAEHGFGKLSTDEIAVQVENLLNRAAAGDEALLMKTIREGTASEARVIYDPDSGLLVTVTPSAPGFGTALGGRSLMQYFQFGQ